MKFLDRILTIVITATLVSAFWIVGGSALIDKAKSSSGAEETGEAVAGDAQGVKADTLATPSPAISSAPATSPSPAVTTGGTAQQRPISQPGDLVIPVAGVTPDQISDSFAERRDGGTRLHEAADIMAPTGSPVVTAAAGTVEKMYVAKSGGRAIYVRSADGKRLYYYAHLGDFAPGLREGMRVIAGQLLGTVEASDDADGKAPHLHFAVLETTADAQWWEPANAIDPYPLLTGKAAISR